MDNDKYFSECYNSWAIDTNDVFFETIAMEYRYKTALYDSKMPSAKYDEKNGFYRILLNEDRIMADNYARSLYYRLRSKLLAHCLDKNIDCPDFLTEVINNRRYGCNRMTDRGILNEYKDIIWQ